MACINVEAPYDGTPKEASMITSVLYVIVRLTDQRTLQQLQLLDSASWSSSPPAWRDPQQAASRHSCTVRLSLSQAESFAQR